jgi:hypothetical protein
LRSHDQDSVPAGPGSTGSRLTRPQNSGLEVLRVVSRPDRRRLPSHLPPNRLHQRLSSRSSSRRGSHVVPVSPFFALR